MIRFVFFLKKLGSKRSLGHLMALFTIILWGISYLFVKKLFMLGYSPIDILFYRFLPAYLITLFFTKESFFFTNLKSEFLFLITGIFGGSLYFALENISLSITQATNVSLIVCSSPLFVTLLSFFIYKVPINLNYIYGSIIAIIGIVLVIINDKFVFKINPIGDVLILIAALSWAIYCLIIQYLNKRYHIMVIIRKLFFYGIITTLPFFLIQSYSNDKIFNCWTFVDILYLGATMVACYFMWNFAVKEIGAISTSNYIYFTPLVTLIASVILINEIITLINVIGLILVLLGVYIAEKK